MNRIRISLVALGITALAITNVAQARQGGTNSGYYVTTCKTTEASPQKTVCTLLKGCYTVTLPMKKTTTCTKKWVDRYAI